MKKSRKKVISTLIFILLVAVTFYALFKNYEPKLLWDLLKKVNHSYLLLGVSMVFVFISCEAECVRIVLKSLHVPITFRKAFVYSCTDYYFSAITPSATGGQPAMAYYMSCDKIPLTKSSIALLLTLIYYMASLLLISLAAFFLHPDFILKSHTIVKVLFIVGIILAVALIIACFMAMYATRLVKRIGLSLIRFGAKIKLVKNPKKKIYSYFKLLVEYRAGAAYVREHPLISLHVFFICLIQRFALFSVIYFVYKSMGLSGHSYFEIISLQALAMLSVGSLPLPGAIGASEGISLILFHSVFGAALTMPAVILSRGINYYLCLVFSGAVTLTKHFMLLRKKDAVRASKP